MIVDARTPQSRRALLAAALGGGIAFVANALGRATPVDAADGDAVVVGGEYTANSVTKIRKPLQEIGGDTAAIWGDSEFDIGVYGTSARGYGVVGVIGAAQADLTHGAGVRGFGPNGTGVKGETFAGTGVQGTAGAGVAVRGSASYGTAVWAEATPGYALRTVGRVRLDKSAGSATIASGAQSVLVTPGIDLDAASTVLATLQGSAGGTTTVLRVAVFTSTNAFRIYLTSKAASSVKVAWLVLG